MKKLMLFALAFFFANRIRDERRRGVARSLLTLGAARAMPSRGLVPAAAWWFSRRPATPPRQRLAWARSTMPR